MCEENVKVDETVVEVTEEVVAEENAIEIEPFFEEQVDFETFSKSDFRVVKVKECSAVKKAKSSYSLFWTMELEQTVSFFQEFMHSMNRKNWLEKHFLLL